MRKFVSVILAFRGGHAREVIEIECLQRLLLSKIMALRFADINSVEQSIEGQENETTRKKPQQNVEKSSLSQVSESSTTTFH